MVAGFGYRFRYHWDNDQMCGHHLELWHSDQPQNLIVPSHGYYNMPELGGGCTCGRIRYELTLNSLDDARTTLCHCHSCKVAMGGAFGLTAKTPIDMFKYMAGCKPKLFVQDNGVHREFCENCGAFLCEYGEGNKDKFRFVDP